MYKVFKICFLILLINTFKVDAQIAVSGSKDTVGSYNVYELTILHAKAYANNWEDVKVSVVFNGVSNFHIDGFYYNTGIWKVRFAPPSVGFWSYTLTFATPDTSYSSSGNFVCVPSSTKGFLQQHPSNNFRLIYPDGSLFDAIGFEDCVLDFNDNGTPLDDFGFDGGFHPPNTLGDRIGLNKYMTAYGKYGARFNLFRWTTDNCTFKLYNNISERENTYLVKEGMLGDTLINSLRDNDIRIWLTFFGPPIFGDMTLSTSMQAAAVKRYISYVVARYGAYVDIWELFNESSASAYYYSEISAYIRSIDPYHRLISVSDERPHISAIDINSPHWYEKESELESDKRAWDMVTSKKIYKKLIMFGEQGNSVQNWDTLSSVRMRLRTWTSFFAEGTLIFWNTSFAKNFMAPIAANIYLGPTERGYIKGLRDFTSTIDTGIRQYVIRPSNTADVRAYGLASKKVTLGYFHHYSSHTNNIVTSFTKRLQRNAKIFWINPTDNSVIDSAELSYGTQVITSPPFMIDIAMRINLSEFEPFFDESKKLDLSVYPNPASTQFTIDGNFNGTATVVLYNEAGKKVLIKNNIINNEPISTGNLPAGLYIYEIIADKRHGGGKLIISK